MFLILFAVGEILSKSTIDEPVWLVMDTVYPKKYAHGFCFAVLCCGYAFTDFPISIRLTSLALWQSNDCPSASKATLLNMDKYFMWIHYERLHNHNKAKHNKTFILWTNLQCKWFLYTREQVQCFLFTRKRWWTWIHAYYVAVITTYIS